MQSRSVVLGRRAHEDADRATAQRAGEDVRPFQRLPGGLQGQPLLRVHGQCLAAADAEEGRVEPVGVGQEAAPPGVALAQGGRVVAEQAGQIPTAVLREL